MFYSLNNIQHICLFSSVAPSFLLFIANQLCQVTASDCILPLLPHFCDLSILFSLIASYRLYVYRCVQYSLCSEALCQMI